MSNSARVVLGHDDLDTMIDFLRELGFVLRAIGPADAPQRAVLDGHGVVLEIDRRAPPRPTTIRLDADGPDRTAPDGTRFEHRPRPEALVVPELRPSLVVTRDDPDAWHPGRAGMRYRDLIPDRQGGRFIASHIRVDHPDGEPGEVPDYVHHHAVRFQIVFCHRGWVEVVYEDHGPPFVLHAGQVVLQPPHIRHRVLRSSDGLEVIEVASPAEHDTLTDPALSLPTDTVDATRTWDGQRFVWGRSAERPDDPWRSGFVARELGVADATGGVGAVRLVRPTGGPTGPATTHDRELQLWFVRSGAATVQVDGRSLVPLSAGDALVVPAGRLHALTDSSDDLELLEVTVPM